MVSLVVVGIGMLFQPGEPDTAVAAGDDMVSAQAAGEPVTLSAIIAETTSTLLEATTTTVPVTTTTEAPTTTAEAPTSTSVAPVTTAETTTTAAPATTAPPVTAASRPAPTTTAPPPPPPTTAAPSAPADGDYEYGDPRGTQVWYDLAQCEAGGNWSINTGNGYYGGLQFSLSAWEGVGGTGYPHEHSSGTQITMGRRLQAQYGWGAWPHCSSELGLR